jgi:Fe-S-cluster-containing dehydrogenase component
MFNWFDPWFPAPLEQQLNPDVTVRYRGVMEKCTFCIQRIKRAEQVAALEGELLKDGDVVPACQQACPTSVFTFGDRNDPNSAAAALFRSRRGFRVLEEQGTDPAIIYLKGGQSNAG